MQIMCYIIDLKFNHEIWSGLGGEKLKIILANNIQHKRKKIIKM